MRAKVSEGLNLSSAAKLGVAETYQSQGVKPDSNAAAGVADSTSIKGNNVQSVAISNSGVITVTYSNQPEIQGAKVTLSPTFSAGSVKWKCAPGTPPVKPRYLPANCRN
ncbi:MAG: pilin [Arenicellales bacterium]